MILDKMARISHQRILYPVQTILSKHLATISTQPEEVQIPVGNGSVLAGKFWNKSGKKTPVIALHGWLDNAGTWDHLCPLLSKDIPLFALDFPGYGYSSVSCGSGVYAPDHILPVEKVRQHFNWNTVNILGHSFGAGVGMLYAGTFPEVVEKLIQIDVVKPDVHPPCDQPTHTAKAITARLKMFAKNKEPSRRFEYSQILQKLMKDYDGAVTEKSAKTLLKRNLQQHDDGLYSTTIFPVNKIVHPILGMTLEHHKAFVQRIQCSTLIIKSSGGPLFDSKDNVLEVLYAYQKYCPKFHYIYLEGEHHIHMNNPEIVCPIVEDFLVEEKVPKKYVRTANLLESLNH